MKRILFLVVLCTVALVRPLHADEGMWLLPLIEKLNGKDMQRLGCRLSPEEIYSINKTSLKDAVAIFGGGCTGELISAQGLLLTNHHCGYPAIQMHSSVEHDYLKEGFWARAQSEEIPTPNLTVTFLESITDVTDRILPELDRQPTETARKAKLDELSAQLQREAGKDPENYRVLVQQFFGGNTYYAIVYRVYRDIRLVGAPPSSIGKFGADTDNWTWPRHTGDFSLFRVYADREGNPAAYSPDNVPYRPKHYFPISLKGIRPNDYAMIMGYPGSTQRYMTSWEVDERMNVLNEPRIKIRGIRQELMMKDMQADRRVRIQYSTKYALSSNYWKNSIGMNRALEKLDVAAQKRTQEAAFTQWVQADTARARKYGEALELIRQAVQARENVAYASLYLGECILRGTEAVTFAQYFIPYYTRARAGSVDTAFTASFLRSMDETTDRFFKDYNVATDEKIAAAMFQLYAADVDREDRADIFQTIKKEYRGDYARFTTRMFRETFLTDPAKVRAFLQNLSVAALENDPVFQVALSASNRAAELRSRNLPAAEQFNKGVRLYMAGLMEMNKGKAMYPDANFTTRLTYGTVNGYAPADGEYYRHYTTLRGVMEKEDPDNWEFEVPQKLKDLYNKKDFGRYAMPDGEMPVAFITNNDITGGNSGSPVLNGRGELIGCAFDGNWEAMSGDIAFEKDLQRCINVDIRYVLFIIDKYAGATNLIKEMKIVGN